MRARLLIVLLTLFASAAGAAEIRRAQLDAAAPACVLLNAREVPAVLIAPGANGEPGLLVLDDELAFELKSAARPGRWSARFLEVRAADRTEFEAGATAGPIETTLVLQRDIDECQLRLTMQPGRPATEDELRRARAIGRVSTDLGTARSLLRVDEDPAQALAVAAAGRPLAERELGPTHPLLGRYAALAGSALWKMGDFTSALHRHEEAERIYRDASGAEAYETLTALANVALNQHELGALETARELYESTAARVDARYGAGTGTGEMIEGNFAALLSEMGLVEDALRRCAAIYAKRSAKRGATDQKTLLALNNLAAAHIQAGRIDEGLDLLREALQRYNANLGALHPDTLRTEYNLLSELCVERKDAASCDEMRRNVRDRSRVLGEDHPEALFSRAAYGLAMARSGKPEQALEEFEAVLALRRAKLGAVHAETLRSLVLVGQMRFVLGQGDQGQAVLQEAIRAADKALGRLHPDTIGFVGAFARGCRRAKIAACEAAALADLVARVEALREALPAGQEQRTGVFASWAPYYRRLAGIQAAAGDVNASLTTVERSKARALLEQVTLRRAEGQGVLAEADVASLQALATEVSAISAARHATTDSVQLAEIETREQVLLTRLGNLRAALRTQNPHYAAASRIEIIGAAEAQRLFGPADLFIDYALVDEELLLFAIDRNGTTVTRGAPARWSALVNAWREAASRAGADPSRDKKAAELSAALLEPLAGRLKGKRHLIVSPDGPLALLPFEALPWQGAPLAARFDISYAQSVSVYAQLARRRPPRRDPHDRTLFAMGAPEFAQAVAPTAAATREAPTSSTTLRSLAAAQANDRFAVRRAYDLLQLHWEPLPGALREIEGVGAMFKDAASYVGARATEDNLEALNRSGELARYRYLLFATHAYLSPEVPALSAIVLRQPGSDTADGYVTAAEWTGYQLNSELVVLSACETGVGQDVAGEGVMGLPFALFAAGNRSTVMSLWKVPDVSTSQFMLSFFKRLRAGAVPSAALAQTKREFIRHPHYSDPLHWAGFVLYGR